MNGDRLAASVALLEIVALEHAGHRMFGGEFDEGRRAHRTEPRRVELDQGALRIEDLEDLLLVRDGVLGDFRRGQPRPRHALAGRIADHAGEITDQKDHVVPELLKLAQFVDEHGMAEMQVGRRRVESRLDAQRRPALDPLAQIRLVYQVDCAPLEFVELLFQIVDQSYSSHFYDATLYPARGIRSPRKFFAGTSQ